VPHRKLLYCISHCLLIVNTGKMLALYESKLGTLK
jgi:hypothetical protein